MCTLQCAVFIPSVEWVVFSASVSCAVCNPVLTSQVHVQPWWDGAARGDPWKCYSARATKLWNLFGSFEHTHNGKVYMHICCCEVFSSKKLHSVHVHMVLCSVIIWDWTVHMYTCCCAVCSWLLIHAAGPGPGSQGRDSGSDCVGEMWHVPCLLCAFCTLCSQSALWGQCALSVECRVSVYCVQWVLCVPGKFKYEVLSYGEVCSVEL